MRLSFFVFTTVVCVLLSVVAGVSSESGSFESNVTWKYEFGTWILTIKGSGEMDDYASAQEQPWYPLYVETVIIEDGVTSIGDFAFSCTACKSVTIPDSVESLGEYSFSSTPNLNEVVIPKGVTTIGKSAFYNSSLTKIQLSDSVTSIGDKCFFESKLGSVTIPSSVESIGDFAFSETNIKSVTIPASVTIFGNSVFAECELLTTAVFEHSELSTIPYGTFSCCHHLKDVTIPSSVTRICGNSFEFCTSLTGFEFPDKLTYIDGYAFRGCTGFKSIVIPDSVKEISHSAFLGCKGLTGVVFPSSLNIIADSSFSMCENLTSVFYLGTYEIPSSQAFLSNVYLINVCVPDGYNSTEFCGHTVTKDTAVCKDFRKVVSQLYNQCYEPEYIGDTIVERKRINATEWEDQTNGCAEYKCDNETGGLLQLLCNTSDVSRMCMNDQCYENWDLSIKGWLIKVVLDDGITYDDINKTAIVNDVYTLSEVAINKKIIGVEKDGNGAVKHIAFSLYQELDANVIAEAITNITKGDDCPYGILCNVTEVSIRDNEGQSSSSSAVSHSSQPSAAGSVHVKFSFLLLFFFLSFLLF